MLVVKETKSKERIRLQTQEQSPEVFNLFCKNNLSIQIPGPFFQHGSSLFAVPRGLPSLSGLRVASSGWYLGEIKSNRFEPSCALALGLAANEAKVAYDLSTEGNRVFMKLSALPFPVIAAVNGFALGGGCELALACDIRIASDNASFSLPEVTLGICPGWGGTQRLARIVGYGIASELMFSAKRIKAERAVQIGLISSVHPSEELMDAATELATQIGANAPLAVAAAKKSMREGVETTLGQGVEIEAREFSALFNSADTKKGLNAFNNKEKYEYKGE